MRPWPDWKFFTCPTCRADAGQSCGNLMKTKKGWIFPRVKPHASRLQKAETRKRIEATRDLLSTLRFSVEANDTVAVMDRLRAYYRLPPYHKRSR